MEVMPAGKIAPKFSSCQSAQVTNSNVLATDTDTPQLTWRNFLHDTAFHTAPSSPINELTTDKYVDSSLGSDEFEFETSRRFANYIELEIGNDFECFVEGLPQQKQRGMKPKRERGGSLPSMAFADELFHNGHVMPLKPPPRLQYDENASFGQGSIPPSPRSPLSSVFKVPYIHKAAWNDDFDPFKAALQKVSEESRRRASDAGRHHRRARSLSPLRTNNSMDGNFNPQILGPKFGGQPKEPKGSTYARFVIDQKKQAEQNAKSPKIHQMFSFRKRVWPLKTDHERTNKISSSQFEDNEGNNIFVVETGITRIRSIFLKYASFGRDNSGDKATNRGSTKWKSNFKKFSFKTLGQGSQNEKKRGIPIKLEAIEHKRNKPHLALCSYGLESPKNKNGQPIRRCDQ